ncbi:MAG: hypothetical protein O3A47_13475 [Chloroflexi bacterium]|nr:hypothetical protein [Chloroflexota bacterium]
MKITKHEPGMFSWADLMTPDVEGSQAFYTQLLGPDPVDAHGRRRGLLLDAHEKRQSRVRHVSDGRRDEADDRRRRLWSAYFTVDSADDTATKAKGLGATLVN